MKRLLWATLIKGTLFLNGDISNKIEYIRILFNLHIFDPTSRVVCHRRCTSCSPWPLPLLQFCQQPLLRGGVGHVPCQRLFSIAACHHRQLCAGAALRTRDARSRRSHARWGATRRFVVALARACIVSVASNVTVCGHIDRDRYLVREILKLDLARV